MSAAASRRVLMIAAMCAAAVALVTLARLAAWPYPLENFEGGCVWAARLWSAGQPLYLMPGSATPPIFNYPPLYAAILRATDSAAHPFLPGRLVSLASVIGLALFAARLAHRSLGEMSSHLVWIAAPVFLIVPETARLGALVRVDALAAVLSLAALVVGTRSGKSRLRLPLAAALGVAAWMTKQTAVAGPLALGVWLLFSAPRRAVVFGAIYALGLGAMIALGEWASGGVFLQNVLGFSVTPFAWGRLAYFAKEYAMQDTAPHALAAIGAVCALWIRDANGRRSPLAFYAVVTTASLVALGKEGSSHLYMFEFHAACAAGLAVGIERAWERLGERTAAVVTGIVGLLVIATIPSVWPSRNVPSDDAADRALVETLRARPGPSILENAGYALVANTPAPDLVNPYLATKLFARGLFDERPILDRVARGDFALIVLESPAHRPSIVTRERFSPDFLRAAATHYAPAGRAGAYVVYTSRATPP